MISYSSRQQINRSNSDIQIQRIQQFDPFATSLTSKLRLAPLNLKLKLHLIYEWEILDKDLRFKIQKGNWPLWSDAIRNCLHKTFHCQRHRVRWWMELSCIPHRMFSFLNSFCYLFFFFRCSFVNGTNKKSMKNQKPNNLYILSQQSPSHRQHVASTLKDFLWRLKAFLRIKDVSFVA